MGFAESVLGVLDRAQHTDWQLAGTCCKCVWNYLAGWESDATPTARLEADHLLELHDFLGSLLEAPPSSAAEGLDVYSSEFEGVASHLHDVCGQMLEAAGINPDASQDSVADDGEHDLEPL